MHTLFLRILRFFVWYKAGKQQGKGLTRFNQYVIAWILLLYAMSVSHIAMSML
jgi:hypothetical protein